MQEGGLPFSRLQVVITKRNRLGKFLGRKKEKEEFFFFTDTQVIFFMIIDYCFLFRGPRFCIFVGSKVSEYPVWCVVGDVIIRCRFTETSLSCGR